MIELIPCPFCSGKAKLEIHKFRSLEPTFGVKCTRCGAHSNQFYGTPISAIKMWNTRLYNGKEIVRDT